MSTIEAFTKQWRDAGRAGDRKVAEELMDEFVRQHFIQPELDSNDMSYLGPRFSFATVLNRGGGQQRVPTALPPPNTSSALTSCGRPQPCHELLR